MSSKRRSKSVKAFETRQEAEDALGAIRDLMIESQALGAKREAARKAADETHAARLQQIDEEITTLTNQLALWADSNRLLFANFRSMKMDHGTIGWRFGNWACKAARGVKVEDIIASLKSNGLSNYIRTKEVIDAEALIADREELDATAARIGIRFCRDERFFVEPNVEVAS